MPGPLPRMSAPDEIVMPLLPFQEEFLAWAVKQEEEYHYGILADEMGMGKGKQGELDGCASWIRTCCF